MNHELYNQVFPFHLFFGYVTIAAAAGAMLAPKGRRIHKFFGKIFVLAMTLTFIMSIPMSIIRQMYLPFLTAVIGMYLTFSGFIYARTRDRNINPLMLILIIIMLCVGISTMSYALYGYNFDIRYAAQIAPFLLGGLACTILCVFDLNTYYYRKDVTNRIRIFKHLTAMLCAATVAVTGFTVPNLTTYPTFVAWVGPSIMAILIILWWRTRLNTPLKINAYVNKLLNK